MVTLENKLNCIGLEAWRQDREICKYALKYHKIDCPLITNKYKCTRDTFIHPLQEIKLGFKYQSYD